VTPKKVVSRQARQVVRASEKMTEFPPEKTIDANTLQCINAIRFLAIDAVEKANSGHPGLPMGCAPMTYVLFNEFMKFNPKNPYFFNRDRFVLSAGHGCMLHYSMLHLTGYDSVKVPPPPTATTPRVRPESVPAPSRPARSTRSSPFYSGWAAADATTGTNVDGACVQTEDLSSFRQWESKCPGHPENFVTPGVEVTTGPLGQGIANAVGLAVAEKHLAARYNKPDATLVDHYTCAHRLAAPSLTRLPTTLAGRLARCVRVD